MTTYLVIVNVAEHSGFVTGVDLDEPGFRYQSVTAPHGTVYGEHSTRVAALEELDRYLECDSVEQGTYCYTHNPVRR